MVSNYNRVQYLETHNIPSVRLKIISNRMYDEYSNTNSIRYRQNVHADSPIILKIKISVCLLFAGVGLAGLEEFVN